LPKNRGRDEKMKKSVVLILTIVFCMVSLTAAQEKGLQAKPEPCAYAGTVKEKLENPNRFILQTQAGLKELAFTHDGKKECVPWAQLAVGDSVAVSCKEKKNGLEATCVKKQTSGTTFQGGTLKGVTIK
jgi:hypothetical protein